MKTTILQMRESGVILPRGRLQQQFGAKGLLEIIDTRENNYNRIMKLALLKNEKGEILKTLYGVSILWLTDDKMGLTGFERVLKDGVVVDYAQSWVCRIDAQDCGRDNQHVMPKRENFRL